MGTSKPWLADNGLRAEARTSRSITLMWSNENNKRADSFGFSNRNSSLIQVSDDNGDFNGDDAKEKEETRWYEVQMKPPNSDSWTTVYRGYNTKCKVNDLMADSNVSFRLRKDGDSTWGTDIIAATDAPPPSAEDLHRAIYCNAEEMTLRIIGNARNPQLKKLLQSHDKSGLTPVMLAAQNGNNEILNVLAQSGADVNVLSMGAQKTPLMLAAAHGHVSTCQFLNRLGAEWLLRDRTGCNVLHYAVSTGSLKLVHYVLEQTGTRLLEDRDESGWTPLMRAIIVGNSSDTVKFLLQRGADPNTSDKNDTKSCLMAAVLLGRVNMVNYLLKANADPDYRNTNGTCIVDTANSSKELKKLIISALHGNHTTSLED